eukprot:1205780-Rhodomonas_salina.2
MAPTPCTNDTACRGEFGGKWYPSAGSMQPSPWSFKWSRSPLASGVPSSCAWPMRGPPSGLVPAGRDS